MNLALLENQDYEKMAQDILETSKTKSEDELFEILGNALYDSGLEISPEDYEEATIPISLEADTKQFNVFKSLNYVADSEPISSKNSKEKGGRLMKRIKSFVCSNKQIKDLITSETKLKDHLKSGIPVVLGLVSTSLSLGPIGMVIAITIIALLIKKGYQKYCGLN